MVILKQQEPQDSLYKNCPQLLESVDGPRVPEMHGVMASQKVGQMLGRLDPPN